MKKTTPIKYTKAFLGFITKGLKPKEDKEDKEYKKAFLGFITKGLKSKKNIDEGLSDLIHSVLPHKLSDKLSDFEDHLGSIKNPKTAYHDIKTRMKHHSLSKQYKFNEHEEKPIKKYTSEHMGHSFVSHFSLNKKLHSGQALDEHHRKFDQDLSSILKKHKTQKDMTVHTGIKYSPERHEDSNSPHEYKMRLPGYTSTSIEKNVAESFARGDPEGSVHNHIRQYKPGYKNLTSVHQIGKISRNTQDHDIVTKSGIGKPKKGHGYVVTDYKHIVSLHVPKGSHGAYIAHHSDNKDEHEFLLHKNAKVHIDKTPEKIDHANGAVHWKGRLVHDGVKGV